jgi:hypothetical protein
MPAEALLNSTTKLRRQNCHRLLSELQKFNEFSFVTKGELFAGT